MSDSGRQPAAELTLAARPLARDDGDLTASQRAAVERMRGMIEEIRERACKLRESKKFREQPKLCSSWFDLDKVLGWREILEPEWMNVLGIIGGRAYGKTTTLMTVLKCLRSPSGGAGKERASGDGTALSGPGFPCDIVLPPINPEMFNGTPEFVLSWVFARLWPLVEELEHLVKEPWCVGDRRRYREKEEPEEALATNMLRTRESFDKVKSAITLLSSRYADKAILLSATRSEFQGEVFEQQRAGLELQHHIHSFFDALFDVLDKLNGKRSLLIVPFDDIDLAEERVAQLMYAVHAYLRHPRVVTILLGDWSAFSLALHREHARGYFSPELLPAGDHVRSAVGRLVDAALFKFLPAQNIVELAVDPAELYDRGFEELLEKIDKHLHRLMELEAEKSGQAPDLSNAELVTQLFSFEVALPTTRPDERPTSDHTHTRYVEVIGRDLRNFNAVRSAFVGLRDALQQLAKTTAASKRNRQDTNTTNKPSKRLAQAQDRVLQAVGVLRSVLARSGRKAVLASRFDEVVRTDWARRTETLDLNALTAARQELDEESFDRLALAVLLYRDLHERVVPLVGPGTSLEVVGSAAGGRTLWREIFAEPVWPWVEDADLPDVAEAGRGATAVLLAERLLEELGKNLRPLGGGSLTGYLASRAAGEDPLARMLVRTALLLAALQVDPATRLTSLQAEAATRLVTLDRDSKQNAGDGDEPSGNGSGGRETTWPASGVRATAGPGWAAWVDRWIETLRTDHPEWVQAILSPEWFITGVRLYRRAAVRAAGARPLAPFADPIRHRWFWKLLVMGAAPLSEAPDERRLELGRLLEPLARGTVAAETMDLPRLLALFQHGLVEVDEEGAWRVTGRGYDLLRGLRKRSGPSGTRDSGTQE